MKIINIALGVIALFAAQGAAQNCDAHHVVSENDDCVTIVNNHGISIDDLIESNPDLDCDNLVVGSDLCINYSLIHDDLEKRGNNNPYAVCGSKSSVKITKTSKYQYGFSKYSVKSGSAMTAIHKINGCSGQEFINFGIKSKLLLSSSLTLFTPACNSHDVCYGCQKGKSTCDTRFKNNMITLCGKKYTSGSKNYKHCKTDASLFYDAVVLFGKDPYKNAATNYKYYRGDLTSCAFCGHSYVVDAFTNPFYT